MFAVRFAAWVRRHWRGQLEPLTAVLGAGLIASALAIALLRTTVWGFSALDLPLQAYAAIEICFFLGTLGIICWAAVGVLRTAWRVRGVAGRNLTILVAVCATALAPGGVRTVVAAQELAQLVVGRDPLGPPATVTREGAVFVLDGMLAQGSAAQFMEIATQINEGDLLVLNSPGGRMGEAEKIAAVIGRLHMATHVDDECSSACTMLMLAGRKRSADVGAMIGFHQPTQDGNNPIDDRLMAEPLREFYLAAKIDAEFVKRALAVSSGDLWYPNADELKRAGVVDQITIEHRLNSLVGFFNHEKRWDLDKDFAIISAKTDESTLELRYRVKSKSRFRHPGADMKLVARQLADNSCGDEDFSDIVEHGGRVVLMPDETRFPVLAIDQRRCREI